MNPIIIHLFDVSDEIFEKIFTDETTTAISKEYGIIGKRSFTYRKQPQFPNFPKKPIFKINWIGYKYPKLSKVNLNTILRDFMKTLEQSNNKNNIIIKFGKNLAEAFAVASANFTIDHPSILFNFEKNDKIEKEFFNRFRLPQYINYIKDKYDPKNPDLNLRKILSYIWEKDC